LYLWPKQKLWLKTKDIEITLSHATQKELIFYRSLVFMIHQNSSTIIYTEIGTSDTILGRAYVDSSCPKDFQIDMTL